MVAPHPDDAALSCAALLERSRGAQILTVFAGAPLPHRQGWWDRRCGFASSAESVPARRREEMDAFAGSSHQVRFLDIPDVQYAPTVRPPEDARAIEAAIRACIEDAPPGMVALPAGSGWEPSLARELLGRIRPRRFAPRQPGPRPSPDHLYLRDVALRTLAEEEAIELLLYEDLPYAFAGDGGLPALAAAEAIGRRADPLVLDVDREQKARRLSFYRSQIPHISPPGRRLDDPAALPAIERYWRLVPASE